MHIKVDGYKFCGKLQEYSLEWKDLFLAYNIDLFLYFIGDKLN